jgi:hypothetical protein
LAEEPKIKQDNATLNPAPATTPSLPVRGVWRTIKSFILWSHERGTIQYDVMVTLILLFVFLSPRYIDFNDQVGRSPRPGDVIVSRDGSGGFVFQVESKAIQGGDDAAVRAQLRGIIEPISGQISIQHYDPVTDKKGNIVAYKVWVKR